MFSPVSLFHRAIKKDPALFLTLKDDRYHDVWHCSFKTQAVAQDVAEVLDEKYVPSTADDIAVFHEKKKFLYINTKFLDRLFLTFPCSPTVRICASQVL
jgi:hypothetical protein